MLSSVPLDENTQYKVEMFVKPVFGNDDEGHAPLYWSIGDPMASGSKPTGKSLLCYSLALVAPPQIPDQVGATDMKVWELYRVDTDVLSNPKTHSTGTQDLTKNYGGVQGTQLYFWGVGGQPLDVLGIKPRYDVQYPSCVTGPGDCGDVVSTQTVRKTVTKENFPVECWVPDPSKNDNCRFYQRLITGNSTPAVLTSNNSSTVPVLDENGVGILLTDGQLYITCADMLGSIAEDNEVTLSNNGNKRRVVASAGRFFRLFFRQRVVKNPYTIDVLYKEVFSKAKPDFAGQTGVSEVTMTEEQGPNAAILQGSTVNPGAMQPSTSAIVNTSFLKT